MHWQGGSFSRQKSHWNSRKNLKLFCKCGRVGTYLDVYFSGNSCIFTNSSFNLINIYIMIFVLPNSRWPPSTQVISSHFLDKIIVSKKKPLSDLLFVPDPEFATLLQKELLDLKNTKYREKKIQFWAHFVPPRSGSRWPKSMRIQIRNTDLNQESYLHMQW